MSQIANEKLNAEIKYVALDHARCLNNLYQTATVDDLVRNAKTIEQYIRSAPDGGTTF